MMEQGQKALDSRSPLTYITSRPHFSVPLIQPRPALTSPALPIPLSEESSHQAECSPLLPRSHPPTQQLSLGVQPQPHPRPLPAHTVISKDLQNEPKLSLYLGSPALVQTPKPLPAALYCRNHSKGRCFLSAVCLLATLCHAFAMRQVQGLGTDWRERVKREKEREGE